MRPRILLSKQMESKHELNNFEVDNDIIYEFNEYDS